MKLHKCIPRDTRTLQEKIADAWLATNKFVQFDGSDMKVNCISTKSYSRESKILFP